MGAASVSSLVVLGEPGVVNQQVVMPISMKKLQMHPRLVQPFAGFGSLAHALKIHMPSLHGL
jgi:hypothetical protein